jgi:hypothetical protein
MGAFTILSLRIPPNYNWGVRESTLAPRFPSAKLAKNEIFL